MRAFEAAEACGGPLHCCPLFKEISPGERSTPNSLQGIQALVEIASLQSNLCRAHMGSAAAAE